MTTESVIQPVEDSRKDAATSIVATTLVASFKKGADHPSYENMITAAILNLKERKGSSRPAIKKYILANYKMNPGNQFDYQISNAIRRGVAKNVFSLPKGSSGAIKLVKPEKKEAKKKAASGSSKKKEALKKKIVKKMSAEGKSTTKPINKKLRTTETKMKKKVAVSPAKKALKKKVAATPKAPSKKASSTATA